MQFVYEDDWIIVCVKPAGVVSTDIPGGMPELVRYALGNPAAEVRTVHRLDQVVSGLMVLARTAEAASELSRQIREQIFEKEYLAVVHGIPPLPQGTLKDLLVRDRQRRMTLVAEKPDKGVQEAVLDYRVLNQASNISRIRIRLHTGRTHQIRVQFSSRGLPLIGERKYAILEDDCNLALWSCRLGFFHPVTGEKMEFTLQPPEVYPWTIV